MKHLRTSERQERKRNQYASESWATVSQELSLAHASLQRANIELRRIAETHAADDILEVQEQIRQWRDDAREQRRAADGIPSA